MGGGRLVVLIALDRADRLRAGPLIWAVTAVGALRVIRGLLYFKDQRPIPGV